MGKIMAICISEHRGTQKQQVNRIDLIENHGLKGDAHAGNWHRQVSLLSYQRIQEFRLKGADVAFGAFGENLVVDGFDFKTFPIGTRFGCNDIVLELTQIGKECHNHCEIYQKMGDCIMPREGVFARVMQGGTLQVGDELRCIE